MVGYVGLYEVSGGTASRSTGFRELLVVSARIGNAIHIDPWSATGMDLKIYQ